MTTIVARRRRRVPSSVAVGLLAGLVVMLLAGFVPLSIAARQLTLNDAWAASTMVIVIACAGVGVVVAAHQPRNPAGWLLLGIAACLGLSIDSGLYAVADYRLRHGMLLWSSAVRLFSRLWSWPWWRSAWWSCSSRTVGSHRGGGGGGGVPTLLSAPAWLRASMR